MAPRAQPLTLRLAAGIAAALVAALVLGTLTAVALRAEGPAMLGTADLAAVRFTLVQASLSALVSVALAIPVARALARRRFPGRRLAVAALGAPFLLPVLVAVLGLLEVFGRNGFVNAGLAFLGLPGIGIYGLPGVVLAHVFLNLPLAARLLLQSWRAIPAEEFRLAAALGMTPATTFRVVELPMLRRAVPGALLAVFLLCLTSFAAVLVLGGGPRATTIELAIYQAFRFDFDLGRAALLGLVQVGLGLGAALLALWAAPLWPGRGLDRPVVRWDSGGPFARWGDLVALLLAGAFLALPIAAIVARGVPGLFDLPGSIPQAAVRSVLVALGATALTLALALPMSLHVAARRRRGRGALTESIGMLTLAASPLVMGTGLFILLNPWVDPVRLALPVTALVNALMALPFALRALVPAASEAEARFGRLADSLGLAGWPRFRVALLPRIGPALGFAAGLTAALSAGDLGVVTLFADPEAATLPLEMYRLMAAYRMEQAAGAALVLVALAFGLFAAFDRGGGRAAA